MSNQEKLKDHISTLADDLMEFGLTNYEAKAYVALIARGYGDADLIAQSAGIPRTSSYKVLSALVDKGFVIVTPGRPQIYKPLSLDEVKQGMVDRLEGIFTQLNTIHGSISETGVPQLIYTLIGRNKVVEKIRSYLDITDREVIISTPQMSEFRKLFSKEIQNMLHREVDIVVITSPFQKVPEGATVMRKEGILAVDLITDGENALIAAPDLSAAGFTKNEFLAEHLARFVLISAESGRR